MEASGDHSHGLPVLPPSSHSLRRYMSWTLLTIWHLFQPFHYSPAFLWFPVDSRSGPSLRGATAATPAAEIVSLLLAAWEWWRSPSCHGHAMGTGAHLPHPSIPELHPLHRKSWLAVFVLRAVTLYLTHKWAWKWLIWLYTYTHASQPDVYRKESLSS